MKSFKQTVISAYANIAEETNSIGPAEHRNKICKEIFEPIADKYPTFNGYQEEANLGLGCNFPFLYADIQASDRCVDLGCAAGIDAFILAELTGPTGQVYGFDITPHLIERAKKIAKANNIQNVHFEQADIELIPLDDQFADVITSNGVFSLLPDKQLVFNEMFRILKPGKRFCIADITKTANFSEQFEKALFNFTGCMNGIVHPDNYLSGLQKAGFTNLEIRNTRNVAIPQTIIQNHAEADDIALLHQTPMPLMIATFFGSKPM